MTGTVLLSAWLAVVTALACASAAAQRPRTPVLVELFTSEGCSSCPPADTLLQSLLEKQPVAGAEVVALSMHVDYWDHQGWKDPFSSKVYTERQQAYARVLGRDPVYTPQMLVDGRDEVKGADPGAAIAAIRTASARPHLPLSATARAVGDTIRLTIDLPAAPKDAEAIDVFVAVTEDALTSAVRRGENAGRTLAHAAVVRSLERSGALEPEAFVAEGQIRLERSWARGNLRPVVWLQGRTSRHVYGSVRVTPQ
jgi:hypothetical protein